MPTVTTIQPYLPVKEALVQPETGALTPVGLAWFQQQAANIAAMAASLNIVIGVNEATVATQPTLGAGDAGYILWLTDYKHTLRWTGAAWEFFGDSFNGYIEDFVIVPQTGKWQLCNGTVVNYLTLGATLTETSFTTPNLIATPAYRKAAAAYTGTINAKGGVTGTDTTGTGTTGSSTDTFTTSIATGTSNIMAGGALPVVVPTHTHTGTTDGHTHSVPGLSIPALGVGSIEMANLGCLPYFRQ